MAAVEAERGDGARTSGRRIGIDDPYARARVTLLSEVARANRCLAVWSRGLGFATVFGDAGDLDAVEVLYTSLLVQATRAMVLARPPVPAPAAVRRRARHPVVPAVVPRRLRLAHRRPLRQVAEATAAAATAGPRGGGPCRSWRGGPMPPGGWAATFPT